MRRQQVEKPRPLYQQFGLVLALPFLLNNNDS